jgi:hypothetical protein
MRPFAFPAKVERRTDAQVWDAFRGRSHFGQQLANVAVRYFIAF